MKKILLFVALTASVSGFAQKVTGQLNLAKGQKLEVRTETKSTVNIEMMGQSMETKVDATMGRTVEVTDVNGSNATLLQKMKNLKMNIESPMAGSQTFDSENDKDMKGDGGKAFEQAAKATTTVVVDNKGKIIEVKGENDKAKGASESNGGNMMLNSLNQFGGGAGAPKAGELIDLTVLPAEGVSKGDSWTVTSGTYKTTYTVKDITDTEILVDMSSEGTSQNKQDAGGMEITMNTKDKITGSLVVDKKTGVVKKKTENVDSDGTMEMMGQSVPMKTKATRVTTTTGF